MSVKVAVYDVSEGWTSLLDYFNVNMNSSSRSVALAMSFVGARTTYTTTYVTHLNEQFRTLNPQCCSTSV